MNLRHQLVWRTLRKNRYHPYKILPTQTLHPGDRERRLEFCRFLLDRIRENPDFHRNVIWSDESKFTNSGMFNRHNEHVWSIENPRVNQERRPQIRFGLNVWVGLLGGTVIGPYIYEDNLTTERYVDFIRTFLTDYIDNNINLNRLRDLWFQQDGAPPHNARRVTEYLSEMFPNRVIANSGDVRWPARSPDLSPLDYFLWGTMKNKVYKTVPVDINDLRQNIIDSLRQIRRRSIERAIANVRKRVELCIMVEGGQFEQLL